MSPNTEAASAPKSSLQTPVTVLGLCGSLRAESSNLRALKAVQLLARPHFDMPVFAALDTLPAFSPDRDVSETPAVSSWVDLVRNAQALIVSSPVYAGGYPGALKNALDWLVSTDAFVDKPFALLNASPRSLDVQDTLIKVITTMSGVHLETATTTLPLLGSALSTEEIVAQDELKAQIYSLISRVEERLAAMRDGD